MIQKVKCEECGSDFDIEVVTPKFCSKICRVSAFKKARVKYQEEARKKKEALKAVVKLDENNSATINNGTQTTSGTPGTNCGGCQSPDNLGQGVAGENKVDTPS